MMSEGILRERKLARCWRTTAAWKLTAGEMLISVAEKNKERNLDVR
jgi:hypothetical protein